ncbi:MAG: hypothetical protein O2779_03460 [Nanoarchaeota archaeon]|nr:hypothetical protein [Nanoarchaeota archaeon]
MVIEHTLQQENGMLSYAGKDVARFGKPCFVFSKKRLLSQYTRIKEGFGAFIPTQVAYSYKTNDCVDIGKVFAKAGSSFLVCNLRHLREVGGFSKNIIYYSACLTLADAKKVLKSGVRRFIIDSPGAFSVLMEARGDTRLDVLFRVATGVVTDGLYPTDTCFGMSFADAKVLMHSAFGLSGLKLGVHNHLISQNVDLDVWTRNSDLLVGFIAELKRSGVTVDYLDLGGGFPIQYIGEDVPLLDTIVESLQYDLLTLKKIFPEMTLIVEPGRFLVGPAGVLVTRVIQTKAVEGRNVAMLDVSVYNASLDSLIVDLQLPFMTNSKGKKVRHMIRGMTPDSLDVFRKEVVLPTLVVGDLVVFFNAGAYTFNADFLALEKIEVKLI